MEGNMMKEDDFLKKRLLELAEKAYQSNTYTFTGFLNMMEISTFHQMKQELSFIPASLSGGTEDSERQMIRFGSLDAFGYEENFPIACIKVQPLMKKFAQDLTHRDFLGACMNLGIERSLLGDIKIKDKEAYIFCKESMAPFLVENLNKVKHTNVSCQIVEEIGEEITVDYKEVMLSVSSLRIDGVVAKLYQLSRSQSLELFVQQKIFLNGRVMEHNSAIMKQGDILSVRGFGKSKLGAMLGTSKKGKLMVQVLVYQ